MDLQGAVIHRLDAHFLGGGLVLAVFRAVDDVVGHDEVVAVGGVRAHLLEPCKHKVVGGQGGAVGPLQALTQGKGIGEAVLGDRVVLTQGLLGLVVGVQAEQALKGVVQNGEGLRIRSGPLDQGADLIAVIVDQSVAGCGGGSGVTAGGGSTASGIAAGEPAARQRRHKKRRSQDGRNELFLHVSFSSCLRFVKMHAHT